ncbi:MAG: N-acyl homoserine lactonase family protein [Geminicoccaceae bacterium]|nr:N-acyl homoserine lactonase family protein [Geminicoccaceae bacterium]
MMTFRTLALAALGLLVHGAGAQAAELRLWRLDCGTIQVNDLDLFSDTFAYAGQSRKLTDGCYLIRHDADYMLWDTGLSADLLGKPIGKEALSPTLDRTIAAQLADIDVKPEQVTTLGISHYHFDHLGQAALFPKAKLLIGAADLAALKAEPPPFGADPALMAPWLQGRAPLEAVAGDGDVFGDGSVTMLSMPGHTPGSHALLVRLPKTGPVLLSGDVVHFEGQFPTGNVPSFNTDRAQSLASMDRLRRMAANLKAVLVVQHDASDIAKLPAFPTGAD